MQELAYIITPNSIIVKTKDGPKTTQKDEDNYNSLYEAIKEKAWDRVERLANKIEDVKHFATQSNGLIEVRGNSVFYGEEELHGYLINKILQFSAENLPIDGLLKFTEKLLSNPSKRCVDNLYKFLECKNMPIDPDGDFYAYKAVRNDFTDKRTGTFDNSVGKIVSVPRRSVDDNPDVECSYGLHAGSIQYVKWFGRDDDKYIIVKINPANVVSVPENDKTKLRCCEYQVVEEFKELLPDTTYHSDNVPDYTWEEDYDSSEEYCFNDEDYLSEEEYQEMVDYYDGIEKEDDEEEEETITSGYVNVTGKWEKNASSYTITTSPFDLEREDIIAYLEMYNIPYTRKSNTEKLRNKLIRYINDNTTIYEV